MFVVVAKRTSMLDKGKFEMFMKECLYVWPGHWSHLHRRELRPKWKLALRSGYLLVRTDTRGDMRTYFRVEISITE